MKPAHPTRLLFVVVGWISEAHPPCAEIANRWMRGAYPPYGTGVGGRRRRRLLRPYCLRHHQARRHAAQAAGCLKNQRPWLASEDRLARWREHDVPLVSRTRCCFVVGWAGFTCPPVRPCSTVASAWADEACPPYEVAFVGRFCRSGFNPTALLRASDCAVAMNGDPQMRGCGCDSVMDALVHPCFRIRY